MNFSDLRAILQYVPQFRGRTFVVALDGAVIDSSDFSNILLDLAVLRSLNVKVVLVHGAAAQIAALAHKRSVTLSNADGIGPTDEATLEVSMDAISRLSNALLQSLTTVRINAATANAIHAHPAGIIRGIDQEFTGTVEKIEAGVLQGFLDQDILPVVPPVGFDSDGQMLRLNSDAIAREVAVALGASKILFVSLEDLHDLRIGQDRQWDAESAVTFVNTHPELPAGMSSKLHHGSRATRDGVPRVHLISSRNPDALLAELFSNEGVGTMIYSDAYQKIRQAAHSDADAIYLLISRAVEDEELIERSRAEILAAIQDYIVLEIDGNIVGTVAVHPHPEGDRAELACLYVKRGHTTRGYGRTLVSAAVDRARETGCRLLFALSTQAAGYLGRQGFARSENFALLPADRREKWAKNGRNALLLTREL